MNYSILQYKYNPNVSALNTVNKIKRNDFERLLDNEAPRVYNNISSQSSNLSNVSLNNVSCLDIDNTGKFLLAGMNDGLISAWAFNDKPGEQGELIDRKLKQIKRDTASDDEEDETHSTATAAQQRGVAHPVREVHSFNVNRNRYRMYRKSNSPMNLDVDSEVKSEKSHRYRIHTIKWYAKDNGLFFTGSNDCKFKMWDTASGFEPIQSVALYDSKNDRKVKINQIDCNHGSGSDVVALATEDHSPRIVDLRNMNYGITFSSRDRKNEEKSEILCCKFNPSVQRQWYFATGEDNGSVNIWDSRQVSRPWREVTSADTDSRRAHTRSCNDLIWNSEGTELVTLGTDGKIKKWQPFGSSATLPAPQLIGSVDSNRNRHKKRTSVRLQWHTDTYLLVNTDHNEVHVYETHTGKLYSKLKNPLPSRRQIDATALQANIANGIGTRIILGTSNSIVEYI
ncbi:hypothetical protein TPHA_0M00990 [Tetrapisispora phaffii CBS 4417]|uniref:Uncharacterized protein n=1 Tax=Tetrapisispora phaffii (strain ATCC 24235 / CBS 4417 / NBRC 1672 / NRRL Y-8282 / UCD 70-5) TaxID=1071381 RepID=G8C0F8_TETPH|nr:hypothetical protein TPHA_0M00990 [Tetrapisispora phaffii CBS 4417]CCE65673.1 hypothetical protein TPHA_0M00990 [Tetrapisispora phaffii CBS 4417]